MEKLAIKGGFPVRTSKLYYGRQWINEDDIAAVEDVLRGDLITCGPKVDEFETALCGYTGAKHAVAVNSGTSALHCACIAAGIGEGDEVITTPITFAASANCALYCGAKPVFADIDPETYNIDPDSIRAHITDKTRAVVAVDYTGQAVKIDEIRKICDENGLVFAGGTVLYDTDDPQIILENVSGGMRIRAKLKLSMIPGDMFDDIAGTLSGEKKSASYVSKLRGMKKGEYVRISCR